MYIQLYLSPNIRDTKGHRIEQQSLQQLNINTGAVKTSKVFSIQYPLSPQQVEAFAHHCLQDHITDQANINQLYLPKNFSHAIAVAKLPGVTDDEGTSAQMALADFFNAQLETNTQHIFSQEIIYIEQKLPDHQLKQLAHRLLGNPLINRFEFIDLSTATSNWQPYIPEVHLYINPTTDTIALAHLSDDELVQLSKKMVLALNLAEMKAVRDHYLHPNTIATRTAANLPANPTDCELEVIAQTWSEHCKHKEFNALIHYHNTQTNETKTIRSLFKTYIKGATDAVTAQLATKNNNWLIKVFSDNAGVVKANNQHLFVWKVETHNSPSALDPYGGAITGILGNNRDPFGTGVGGARLLFNTNVLCFGLPNYNKPLLTGQLHPRQIMDGVVAGVEAGGNKSGVPTVNGAVVFDERFSGKPLVYCGTGALMKHQYNGLPTWEKPIDINDRIVMAGGRVGKDGIHGATFSSIEIDEHSPMSAVQIGSPITQKKMYDFLVVACEKGLVKSSTDNGAGGLSSSIGELATISGGAMVYLDKVPLKYSGLRPWEIFVSESQERMSLVIEPQKMEALFTLAAQFEVELTDIGYFTNSGNLHILYNNQTVALLDMHFLHEGVPLKTMLAQYTPPIFDEPNLPKQLDYNQTLLQLLGSFNICSRENIIRQYDHEVKGKTIIKPLMGNKGKAPQDAAVVRMDFDNYEGIAISNGILPRYGDIDAYQMSAGAFDEAVRQIISVGGQLPNINENDGIFWSVNDNFCVPDSDYHPETNPDGKQKLAKLVQMCEALYDMAVAFAIPLTSGKDSMKNDFKADGIKISVPPTILYSMAAKINDVRRTITSEFKAPNDLIYQLGETYNELGASEFYHLFNAIGNNVPKIRPQQAKDLYLLVMEANKNGWIQSSHDLSDGGLAVTLAECCFGSNLGANIDVSVLGDMDTNVALFSESHSRFVVTVSPQHQQAFEQLMGNRAFCIGLVTQNPTLSISYQNQQLLHLNNQQMLMAWSNGLEQ